MLLLCFEKCTSRLQAVHCPAQALGSVLGSGTTLQAARLSVSFPIRSLDFLIDQIVPAVLWP
jgi:hypothetical protein